MSKAPLPPPNPSRRMRGFEPTFGLVKDPIRAAGESRGFAVTRLLTHWPEVVGEELAGMTRPVKIGYARDGFGATLTVLVSSAHAPMVQMQLPKIIEKVNAVYGYAAISRISLTQTAPTGFAEGQAEFMPAPKVAAKPDPVVLAKAAETAAPIADAGLRAALEALAQNILTRRKT
ncbi:DUF721 domain-containing protein [Paragemmobacter straminiformis]|uniref:DUF721 domain-containing protein n=1 Tax=Paragemmobacter straminiformis TaxID=2045119 RepID=A0A842I7R6_9RHOB|nr:DUF721 domain-containing protein [Gemmobacter straminiformis]MBC2836122.1 DUF721 domain-containing protein [Gemmobacter straminiformis]